MDCNKYLAEHYLYGLIPYQRDYSSGQLHRKEIQVLHTNLTPLFLLDENLTSTLRKQTV